MNYEIELNGRKHQISMTPNAQKGGYQVTFDGGTCDADVQLIEPNILSLLIEQRAYRILFDPRSEGDALLLGSYRIPYKIKDPRSLRSRAKADEGNTGARSVIAPMPGRIVRIMVQMGDTVEAQQGLIVMEAMKMQNELKAPKAGLVTRLTVESDATVQAGQVLLVIE